MLKKATKRRNVDMLNLMKEHIAKTITELLKAKPLEKIRVTEICKKANINRTTFYNHFKDKYDLIAWIFYRHVLDVNILDFNNYVTAMKRMKKEMNFYKNSFNDNAQNILLNTMHDFYVSEIVKVKKEKEQIDELSLIELTRIRRNCFGTLYIFKEWILGQLDLSAEEMVQLGNEFLIDYL